MRYRVAAACVTAVLMLAGCATTGAGGQPKPGTVEACASALSTVRTKTDATFSEAQTAATCLSAAYAKNAGVHRDTLSYSSWATSGGAVGALAAGGQAAGALGYVAFAPVLINQLMATEPKRDLYFGAGLAIEEMGLRYWELDLTTKSFEASPRTYGAEVPGCGEIAPKITTKLASVDTADAGVLINEGERLTAHCDLLRDTNDDLALLGSDVGRLRPRLPQSFAHDVTRLHNGVLANHQQVLFTPGETLSTVLASPFKAVDQVLSPQSAQSSVHQANVENTFKGLDLTLMPTLFRPGGLRAPLPAMPVLSPRVAEIVDDEPQDGEAENKDAATIKEAAESLGELHAAISAQHRTLAGETEAAVRVLDIGARDRLVFQYDPVTRMVRPEVRAVAPATTAPAAAPSSPSEPST